MFLAGSFIGFSIVYVVSPSVIHAKYCCSTHGNKEGIVLYEQLVCLFVLLELFFLNVY